jgi:hypothetical protein
MKRPILFFLLALFCMPIVKSQSLFDLSPSNDDQDAWPLTWSAGAGIGFDYANVAGSDTDNEDALSTVSIELDFHLNLSEHFGLQAELEYANQGYSFNDTDVKLTYLNVPIMADYEIVDNLSLQAGPQFGFNLCARSIFGDIETDIDVESVDIGVGIGAQYRTNWNGLFFNVRYTRGFTDIYSNFNASNSVIGATVGLFIIGNEPRGDKKGDSE